MSKALIKIAYRQVMDASAQNSFEKNVLQFSYEEFKMKSQVYNPEGKFKTFSELKANDGRANSLHYKSGFAVIGFIDSLNKQIPYLTDTLGQTVLFNSYKFEVIESDITNKLLHKVAITYYSDSLVLFEIIGDCILLAPADKVIESENESVETFMVKMQHGLSVSHYKENKEPVKWG
ncbi:MAG: hypothetical protein QM737_08425 [Ferruginibacter sp.]